MFATYPNEDYDRRNEDVDPMAASAEYELEKRVERLDLFPVELEKGAEHNNVRSYCRRLPVTDGGLGSGCTSIYYSIFNSLRRWCTGFCDNREQNASFVFMRWVNLLLLM